MTKYTARGTLLFYACILVPNVALAQSEKRGAIVTILGSPSCQSWNAEKEKARRTKESFDRMLSLTNQTWLVGFLSGVNYGISTGKNLLHAADSKLIVDWMDKYCKENLDKSVYDGGVRLIEALEKITK